MQDHEESMLLVPELLPLHSFRCQSYSSFSSVLILGRSSMRLDQYCKHTCRKTDTALAAFSAHACKATNKHGAKGQQTRMLEAR